MSVEWGRLQQDSVSATVGEDDSEETGDGAEDGDNPHALMCAAHSTALNCMTPPIAPAHACLPRRCIVWLVWR